MTISHPLQISALPSGEKHRIKTRRAGKTKRTRQERGERKEEENERRDETRRDERQTRGLRRKRGKKEKEEEGGGGGRPHLIHGAVWVHFDTVEQGQNEVWSTSGLLKESLIYTLASLDSIPFVRGKRKKRTRCDKAINESTTV